MEDRFLQQLKRGVVEMLVLEIICQKSTYGYELLMRLKEGAEELRTLKEGTLYPILYRLEDDGMIQSSWLQGEGRAAPKKMYAATEAGRLENRRQRQVWQTFSKTVDRFCRQENEAQ